jgi:RTX calcium-binding nonapeptide repeat (4 copies)
MRPGRRKLVLVFALLAICVAVAPASASAGRGLKDAVWTVHGHGASTSSSVNVLTLNDQRGIDNRITAYIGSGGRLVLSAPEGLGDPDGSGVNCGLDNAKTGETSAPEVSCAAGYISAIVGELSRGSDTFDADPGLPVMVGAVIDGQVRPLAGGPGRDRLIGGSLADLLEGDGGPDSIAGGGGMDLLLGGPGADNLSGGGGSDNLLGGSGPDKLSGGSGKDSCKGAGGTDTAKNCETVRGIP